MRTNEMDLKCAELTKLNRRIDKEIGTKRNIRAHLDKIKDTHMRNRPISYTSNTI